MTRRSPQFGGPPRAEAPRVGAEQPRPTAPACPVLPPIPLLTDPGLAHLHRAITENTAAVRELTAELARRETVEAVVTSGDETIRLEVKT